LTSTDYTTVTWNTLTGALAMDHSTQAEIVAKTNAITGAIAALVFAGEGNLASAE
jgi:hypothetical protein